MRCDHCQALLLDHLYGLLDGPEGAAVDAHLADCLACSASREQATRARELFARAARFSFPDVRFTPPVEAAPPVGGNHAPTTIPSAALPPKGPARREWSAWASVAAVVFLIPSTILPVRLVTGNYDDARNAVNDAAARYGEVRAVRDGIALQVRTTRGRAEANYDRAKSEHDDILARWVAAELAADQGDRNRKLTVEVDRPAALQPGAPNEVVVIVKDPSGLPPGRVEARVRDQLGKVLVSQAIDPNRPDQRHPLKIPAAVWAELKPQSELYLSVVAVDEKPDTALQVLEEVRLFGPVYATMLVTDKATYRPGERVFFRSLTLDRVSLRPPDGEQVLRYELRQVSTGKPAGELVGRLEDVGTTSVVRVTDGKVEPVFGTDRRPVRGVGCGAFVLPDNLADGDYTLVLTEEGPRSTIPVPVTRTVRVRSGLPEKYTKLIGFEGASFGPGETVKAWAELKLGKDPVPKAKVLVAGEAEGREFVIQVPNGLVTNDKGRADFTFPLPRQLARGDVQLKVTFEPDDGSRSESVAKRIPVTGREVIVETFPEGGYLIAGVPCKVYVRATNAAGHPVDISGVVTDGKQTVAEVQTVTGSSEPGVNRGLGAFTFIPEPNATYSMRLAHPTTTTVRLGHDVKLGGVAMHVLDPVTAPGEPVRVKLHSPDRKRTLVVGAYTRGRLADTRRVDVTPGEAAQVELMTGSDPRGGVTRITVFEMPEGKPVAERLVFRKPGERLNLEYTTKRTGPDGRVDLTIAATNEKGDAVPAIVWVAAVNSAVAPGPKDRLLPTHFLLAGEVQTPDALEHADFLLTDHPKAAEALDRVLATQGWRRFAEQQPPIDLTQKRLAPLRDAERLQLLSGQYRGGVETLHDRNQQSTAMYRPFYEAAVAWLEKRQQEKEAAEADKAWEPDYHRAKAEAAGRRPEVAQRLDALRSAAAPLGVVRKVMWAAVGALIVLGGGFAFLGARGRRPFGLAAVGSIGLAAFLLMSDSGIAARAATVIPETPVETDIDPTTPQIPKVEEPGILWPKEPTGPLMLRNGGQTSPVTPGLPPTNTTTRPLGPVVPVKDGSPVILDPRPRIDNEESRPRQPGRPTSPSHEANRVAADKKAAGDYATERWEAIGERIRTSVAVQKDAAVRSTEVLGRLLASVPKTPPLVVREYAAPRPTPTATPADEPDTVLWVPVIVLPSDGKATLPFHAGSAQGGYQILVAGHTLDGRLGAVRGTLPATPTAPVPTK